MIHSVYDLFSGKVPSFFCSTKKLKKKNFPLCLHGLFILKFYGPKGKNVKMTFCSKEVCIVVFSIL